MFTKHPIRILLRGEHPIWIMLRGEHPIRILLKDKHPIRILLKDKHSIRILLRGEHPIRILHRGKHPIRILLRGKHPIRILLRGEHPIRILLRGEHRIRIPLNLWITNRRTTPILSNPKQKSFKFWAHKRNPLKLWASKWDSFTVNCKILRKKYHSNCKQPIKDQLWLITIFIDQKLSLRNESYCSSLDWSY